MALNNTLNICTILITCNQFISNDAAPQEAWFKAKSTFWNRNYVTYQAQKTSDNTAPKSMKNSFTNSTSHQTHALKFIRKTSTYPVTEFLQRCHVFSWKSKPIDWFMNNTLLKFGLWNLIKDSNQANDFFFNYIIILLPFILWNKLNLYESKLHTEIVATSKCLLKKTNFRKAT